MEPNPGPCLGGVLPLTPAMRTLLALLMVGLGDLWLWVAQPASMWPPAAAEAPLSGAKVQSCQALLALHCARACGKVQAGVQSCQAPALARSRAQSCQALLAHQRAHASGGYGPDRDMDRVGIWPVQGSSLVRPQHKPAPGPSLARPCWRITVRTPVRRPSLGSSLVRPQH